MAIKRFNRDVVLYGGAVLKFEGSTPVSTNFYKDTVSNGVTTWVGKGVDPNGVLAGTAGDFLINGAANKPAYCTGGTVWVNLV